MVAVPKRPGIVAAAMVANGRSKSNFASLFTTMPFFLLYDMLPLLCHSLVILLLSLLSFPLRSFPFLTAVLSYLVLDLVMWKACFFFLSTTLINKTKLGLPPHALHDAMALIWRTVRNVVVNIQVIFSKNLECLSFSSSFWFLMSVPTSNPPFNLRIPRVT